MVSISGVDDDKIGLSEEELVKTVIEETKELVSSYGFESKSEYSTAVIAGEEHPVQIDTGDPDCVDMYFYIVNGGFMYQIIISAADEEAVENLLTCFEKI